jgi:ribonuclease G
MKQEILINSAIGETRMALLEQGQISEIRLYRDHIPSYVGAIYLGRVAKLSSEFQAAFIDLDHNLVGFLPLKNLPKSPGKKPKDLTALLVEGQRIIVQVTADAAVGKSLKLTGRVELISTAIVLHPFRVGAYVSSRIKDPDKRAELKQFGEDMKLEDIGLTFRTEAEHIPLTQLSDTAKRLINQWQMINKTIKTHKCPALLTQGPDAIEQIMREYSSAKTESIVIDQASAFKKAKHWATQYAPELSEKINLYSDKINIFSKFDIDDQLEHMSSPQIRLNSGAWIIIEETEALTAIDVNMGDARYSDDYEKQIFSVNQEAAREIFRQLRLRSIGGLIVIDFIDMATKGQIRSFLNFIDELMLKDTMPVQRGNISSFGLLELTRKTSHQSLSQLMIKKYTPTINLSSQCLHILREAENNALQTPGQEIRINISLAQKKWFEDHGALIDNFRTRTRSTIKMDLT